MTDVLSYRTQRMRELSTLAKQKNCSISQLSSNIINEYLDFHKLFSGLETYTDIRGIISSCFESVNENELQRVMDVTSEAVTQSMKAKDIDSFDKVVDIITTFFLINKFELQQFDKKSHIKFTSKNTMPKNWNTYVSNTIMRLFKNSGYDGMLETIDEGLFCVKISKELQV